MKSSENLYKIIDVPIVNFILKMVEDGILRLNSFLVIKNLLNKLNFQDILLETFRILKFGPNLKNLTNFWEIKIQENFFLQDNYKFKFLDINKVAEKSIFKT